MKIRQVSQLSEGAMIWMNRKTKLRSTQTNRQPGRSAKYQERGGAVSLLAWYIALRLFLNSKELLHKFLVLGMTRKRLIGIA